MLNFICGQVVHIGEGTLVVQNGGIGYEFLVSSNTLQKCPVGETVQLHAKLVVKEDALLLFGFATAEEKSMFNELITVSGIGPKTALAILSGMRADDLGLAILNADTTALQRIKGLGKKSAERIVLELREKMSAYVTSVRPAAGSGAGAIPAGLDAVLAEAVSILRTLGLPQSSAITRARAALDAGAQTTEAILQFVLKNY